ncbi:hypothetical protein BSKO_09362 [Bryopsis sp. KO-2023]|nr:hypothetical protein BSKO_09362 [Bryopsis sp. KO-2023]
MLAQKVVAAGASATQAGSTDASKAGSVVIPGKNGLRREINLLLTVEERGGKQNVHSETINVMAEETIQNLKLRLRNRGFFTSRHCLVFGERKLMENERIGEVASRYKEPDEADFLHVFARLSDVESIDVKTDKRNIIYTQGDTRLELPKPEKDLPRSVLTSSLSGNMTPTGRELMLRGRVVSGADPVPNFFDRTEPVVHLIIRKTTQVKWQQDRGDHFEISISALDTVDTVKKKVEEVANELVGDGEYRVVHGGEVLDSEKPLAMYGIGKGSILELVPLVLEEFPAANSSPKLTSPSSPNHQMHENWNKAKDALAKGVKPKLTPAGTGGSYFILSHDGQQVAVFKPEDEEPLAPNNPKGYSGSPTGEGLRKGVRPGEGATREVIAYVLDHGHFAGVPATAMVSLSGRERERGRHRKVGSFQQFVHHEMDCEEMGPSKFPLLEVQKICVLDIRLANTDRNGGNILARRNDDSEWQLTPIDHGYCVPDSFVDINFEWIYWPQAKVPFCKVALEYISSLDAERDLLILRAHGLHLRRECERVFRVCTMLLKKCAAKGLTPKQIGQIMCRESFTRSPLEKMEKRALQLSVQEEYGPETPVGSISRLGVSDKIYLRSMESVLDQYLEDVDLADSGIV